MTQTCLPIEAYYHINRNTPRVQPRFKAPEDPEIEALLLDLGAWVAHTREWEASFRLIFGDEAFEEDYPAIDWRPPQRSAGKVQRRCNSQKTAKFIFLSQLVVAEECAPRDSNPEPID